ncbi:MAG: sugar transferase [Nitrospirae bacterium]|nr:sugar transferase [Nitrospirota bacterium]
MRYKKYKIIFLLLDSFITYAALKYSFYFVNYARNVDYTISDTDLMKIASIVIFSELIIFKISGLYRMHKLLNSYYQFVVVIKSMLVSFGLLIAILFIFKHPILMLRREIVASFFILLILFLLYRILFVKISLGYVLKNKIIGSRVILIGADNRGCEIARELRNNKYSYFHPIGFLDDFKESGEILEGIKVLDKIENVGKYSEKFDEILIALTNVSYNKLQRIIDTCRRLHRPIHVISDLYRIVPEKLEVEKFSGFSTFQIPPITGFKEYTYIILKRIIDYTVALVFVILLLPLWFIIAILIKIDSKGPVFYRAEVVGYKEKKFVWYKFRSMAINKDDSAHRNLVKAEAMGLSNGQKLQNDPRITSVGKWLRKFSIDEFPQLINVLKGQMSLVGPRPVLPYEYELLDNWQKERFAVLPGLTGLWQVHGRNRVNFADQHVLDLYYVRNRSIALDLEILFNTISVVISGETGV